MILNFFEHFVKLFESFFKFDINIQNVKKNQQKYKEVSNIRLKNFFYLKKNKIFIQKTKCNKIYSK